MNQDDHNPGSLPPALRRRLREASSPPLFVPPQADEAVLRAARQHLAPLRRRGLRVGRFHIPTGRVLPWTGAAAAAAIVIGVLLTQLHTPSPPTLVAVNLEQVTILDAFELARKLRDDETLPPGYDVTGDGAVNQHDVEALATRAVRLRGGEG